MSGEGRFGRCAQSAFVGSVAMVKIRCAVLWMWFFGRFLNHERYAIGLVYCNFLSVSLNRA